MFTTTVTWSLLLTILVSTVTGEKDRESEWTVEIGAGKEDRGWGSRNELDINFRIYRPNNGMILVSDFKKSDNAHRTSLIIDGEDEDEEDGEEVPEDNSLLKNMEEEDIQVSKIDKALKIMKEHITRSRQFQDLIKASEYRDRSVAEHNFENVNFWSLVHLSIMIVSGICQVILVRSLFDDKSRFHAIWKKIC
ncbi:TMED5 [Lepeophtheirus salmonis]|uniref:TMED5 n=1 Tax=Lepeophtheirus salmonis TaxID=72036 RepID=A0A7R8HDA2_LEPSM|nr:TMED5 [Lepeophtheirus salmonis]CAF3030243.1 TMED5 [Lepeophtheirus salmonis]